MIIFLGFSGGTLQRHSYLEAKLVLAPTGDRSFKVSVQTIGSWGFGKHKTLNHVWFTAQAVCTRPTVFTGRVNVFWHWLVQEALMWVCEPSGFGRHKTLNQVWFPVKFLSTWVTIFIGQITYFHTFSKKNTRGQSQVRPCRWTTALSMSGPAEELPPSPCQALQMNYRPLHVRPCRGTTALSMLGTQCWKAKTKQFPCGEKTSDWLISKLSWHSSVWSVERW